eukprot:SM000190S04874  [mRNA]  locus=s190:235822:236789:+ [translate_table: standard]
MAGGSASRCWPHRRAWCWTSPPTSETSSRGTPSRRRPVTAWQVFVYICAQYDTSRISVSQVSLWDNIIQDKAQARFHFPELRAKYGFIDQGNTLRGQPFNLTLHWNVMPISGALREGSKSFSGFRLPNDYL